MVCLLCGASMTHMTKDLYMCRDDGMISSAIMPRKPIYNDSYLKKFRDYEDTEKSKKLQQLRYDTVHKHICKGRLLDYGCGPGSFIKFANFNGLVSTGFDVNQYSEYCDPSVLLSKYDVVTFWDVIEHIENPIRLISGINADYVFISSPSTDDFESPDLTAWVHYRPAEHVHYFNEKSLGRLLNICGYEIIETHYRESNIRTGKGRGEKNILTIGGKRG